MADLLKCPFCGGEAKIRHYEDIKKDFVSVYEYYVECANCKAQSGWKANIEDVVNAWNTRKPMEAVVAELEAFLEGGLQCNECAYMTGKHLCRGECEQGAFAKAISIVRGKE